LFRMWEFFLAYSVIASGQGSATCWQILAHPNVYDYNFDRWVDKNESMYGSDDRAGSYDYQPGAEAVLSDKAFTHKTGSSTKSVTKKKSTPKKNRSSTPKKATPKAKSAKKKSTKKKASAKKSRAKTPTRKSSAKKKK